MSLLETRRLLLVGHGYHAKIATPEAVDQTRLSAGFDLVILSASISQSERERILAIASTRTLALENFAMPNELLGMIQQRLPKASSGARDRIMRGS